MSSREAPVNELSISTPRSFLGKTQGVKLLAIEWRTGDATDQVALRVPDLDAWVQELGGVTSDRPDLTAKTLQ